MKVSLGSKLQSLKNRYHEHKISKYFRIHDRYTYDKSVDYELFSMRQPIARFAQKNNLNIDVYNVQELEARSKSDVKIPEIESSIPRISLVVTNQKNGLRAIRILDADPSKVYPKESASIYICNVPGEQDLQVSKTTRSTVEDTFLRHVFRTLSEMKNQVTGK